MNKILNWTFGSVFRTFGRIIAYILVAVLFSYILSKTGFKISDLFLENVKADTYQNTFVVSWKDYQGNNLPTIGEYNYMTTASTSESGGFTAYEFTTNLDIRPMKGSYIEIPFYMSIPNAYLTTQSTIEFETCQRYSKTTINNREVWECILYSSNTNYIDERELLLPKTNVYALAVYNNGYADNCELNTNNNMLRCPIASTQDITTLDRIITYTKLYFGASTFSGSNYSVGLGFRIRAYKNDTNTIINSIDSQTQQQQQQHEEIMDTNSTQTESSASDLFNNSIFEDQQGGLSSIITAPLVMINQMLSNTCVSPSATWKGQTISLPCGSMLWDRPNASQLKDLLNVFYGGFICYYAIRKLFLMIEKMKDPTSDNIEVTDL